MMLPDISLPETRLLKGRLSELTENMLACQLYATLVYWLMEWTCLTE